MSTRHKYNRVSRCQSGITLSSNRSEEVNLSLLTYESSQNTSENSTPHIKHMKPISDESISVETSKKSPRYKLAVHKSHTLAYLPYDSELNSIGEDSQDDGMTISECEENSNKNITVKERKIIKSHSVMDILEIDQTIVPHSSTTAQPHAKISPSDPEEFKSFSISDSSELEFDSLALEKRNEVIYQQHLYVTYQAMSLVKTLTPLDPAIIKAKEIELPRLPGYENRKTVIFDLDETLIHCARDFVACKPDVYIPIVFTNGDFIEAGINIRPYVKECLEECGKYMEVMVFTASNKTYADAVLDYLDPDGMLIHHRLYRDHCIFVDQNPVKDLRIIKNRNLKDIVIVDNCAFCFGYQVENGIPIIAWTDDKFDRELYNLTHYIRQLATVEDVRLLNRETFKLESFFDDFTSIMKGEDGNLIRHE
jgi:Dullard-like phosphatase family protein